MTEPDYPTFERGFRSVYQTLARSNLKAAELVELARNYFRAFEAWPIEDVLAGAHKCIASHRTMPRPADWIAELPPAPFARPQQGGLADVRWLSAAEMSEHDRAAALGYRDGPCACDPCRDAGVSDRELRFIPN